MCILDQFSKEDLSRIIEQNASLRGYVQGYLGEDVLITKTLKVPNVTSVTKIRDHDKEKGDLLVIYKDKPITIELKSITTDSAVTLPNGEWEGKVDVKNSDLRNVRFPDGSMIRCNLISRNQFDILGISCYAAAGDWEFLFLHSNDLPKPKTKRFTEHQKQFLVRRQFRINKKYTPGITDNLEALLEQVYVSKS